MSIPNISGLYDSSIDRFDPIENTWTQLGKLNKNRSGHAVIQVDDEFIVVGSAWAHYGEVTESCKLNGPSMTCTTREPTVKMSWYPELMLVQ